MFAKHRNVILFFIIVTLVTVGVVMVRPGAFKSDILSRNPGSVNIDIPELYSLRGNVISPNPHAENLIPAFKHALTYGVTGIETQLTVSKDMQLVVSSEPWFRDLLCLKADGTSIVPPAVAPAAAYTSTERETKARALYNFSTLNYSEIKQFNCAQLKTTADMYKNYTADEKYKPLLKDVVMASEKHVIDNALLTPSYTLELTDFTKYAGMQPADSVFAKLAYDEVTALHIKDRVIFSSSRPELLNAVIALDGNGPARVKIRLNGDQNIAANVQKLTRVPDYYALDFSKVAITPTTCLDDATTKVSVDQSLINAIHSLGMKALITNVTNSNCANVLYNLRTIDGFVTSTLDRVQKYIRAKIPEAYFSKSFFDPASNYFNPYDVEAPFTFLEPVYTSSGVTLDTLSSSTTLKTLTHQSLGSHTVPGASNAYFREFPELAYDGMYRKVLNALGLKGLRLFPGKLIDIDPAGMDAFKSADGTTISFANLAEAYNIGQHKYFRDDYSTATSLLSPYSTMSVDEYTKLAMDSKITESDGSTRVTYMLHGTLVYDPNPSKTDIPYDPYNTYYADTDTAKKKPLADPNFEHSTPKPGVYHLLQNKAHLLPMLARQNAAVIKKLKDIYCPGIPDGTACAQFNNFYFEVGNEEYFTMPSEVHAEVAYYTALEARKIVPNVKLALSFYPGENGDKVASLAGKTHVLPIIKRYYGDLSTANATADAKYTVYDHAKIFDRLTELNKGANGSMMGNIVGIQIHFYTNYKVAESLSDLTKLAKEKGYEKLKFWVSEYSFFGIWGRITKWGYTGMQDPQVGRQYLREALSLFAAKGVELIDVHATPGQGLAEYFTKGVSSMAEQTIVSHSPIDPYINSMPDTQGGTVTGHGTGFWRVFPLGISQRLINDTLLSDGRSLSIKLLRRTKTLFEMFGTGAAGHIRGVVENREDTPKEYTLQKTTTPFIKVIEVQDGGSQEKVLFDITRDTENYTQMRSRVRSIVTKISSIQTSLIAEMRQLAIPLQESLTKNAITTTISGVIYTNVSDMLLAQLTDDYYDINNVNSGYYAARDATFAALTKAITTKQVALVTGKTAAEKTVIDTEFSAILAELALVDGKLNNRTEEIFGLNYIKFMAAKWEDSCEQQSSGEDICRNASQTEDQRKSFRLVLKDIFEYLDINNSFKDLSGGHANKYMTGHHLLNTQKNSVDSKGNVLDVNLIDQPLYQSLLADVASLRTTLAVVTLQPGWFENYKADLRLEYFPKIKEYYVYPDAVSKSVKISLPGKTMIFISDDETMTTHVEDSLFESLEVVQKAIVDQKLDVAVLPVRIELDATYKQVNIDPHTNTNMNTSIIQNQNTNINTDNVNLNLNISPSTNNTNSILNTGNSNVIVNTNINLNMNASTSVISTNQNIPAQVSTSVQSSYGSSSGGSSYVSTPSQTVTNPSQNVSVSTKPAATVFNDIESSFAKEYILKLNQAGILDGRSPGIFEPNGTLNRAEAAKLIVTAFAKDQDAAKYKEDFQGMHSSYTYLYFPDVLLSSWYAGYVGIAKEMGIIKGTTVGTFEPSRGITRAEFLKMVLEGKQVDTMKESNTFATSNIGYYTDVTGNAWYRAYVYAAGNIGLIDKRAEFSPDRTISRAEAAKILGKAL